MNDDAELDLAARIRAGDPEAMRVLLDRKPPRTLDHAILVCKRRDGRQEGGGHDEILCAQTGMTGGTR